MTERSVFIRLAVKDADKAISQLNRVGVRGERAIGRIERASKPASRGLLAVSATSQALQQNARGMASSLGVAGAGMTALGPAGIAGAAAIAGLVIAARKLSQATKEAVAELDAIAKTADNIGLSTDALQELRFAAERMGVEVSQVDNALGAFGKRLGELRAGTGSLSTLLDKTDPALKTMLVNARNNDEALDILLNRMAETADQADRLALSSAAFGRGPGIEMAKVVRDGAAAMAALRQEARDLGVVIDEHLLRQAEGVADQLTNMETVIDANLNAALLSLSPLLIDTAKLFASIARAVGDVVDSFRDLEDRSTRGLERRLEDVRANIASLQKELTARQQNPLLRLFGAGDEDIGTLPGAEGQRLRDLRAEEARIIAQLEEREAAAAARAAAAANAPARDRTAAGDEGEAKKLDQLRAANAELVAQLRLEARTREATDAVRLAGVAGLDKEQAAAVAVARAIAIETAQRRLNAEATPQQRAEVARLTGAIFDQEQATKAATDALRDKAQAETEAQSLLGGLRTEEERLNDQLERTRELYDEGALSLEEYNLAVDRLRNGIPGAKDALNDFAADMQTFVEGAGQSFGRNLVDWASNVKGFSDSLRDLESSILSLANSIISQNLGNLFSRTFGGIGSTGGAGADRLTRIAQADIAANPDIFGGGGGGFFDDIFGFLFHGGGRVGPGGARRKVPAVAFAGAPRLHNGSAPGLRANEFAAILERGERVLTGDQMRGLGRMLGRRSLSLGGVHVTVTGDAGADPGFTGDQIGVAIKRRLADLDRDA